CALIPIPGTQAALTARKAGCWICEVKAESFSWVEMGPQSSRVQKASGARAQSPKLPLVSSGGVTPGQKRGGGDIAGGGGIRVAAPGARRVASPSSISADQDCASGSLLVCGGCSQ